MDGSYTGQRVKTIFDNPSVLRADIDRKIRQFKAGAATEQEVRDLIRSHMEGP